MNWYFLSLSSAFFQVLRNVSIKSLAVHADERVSTWARVTFILPFAGLAVWINGVPPLTPTFYWLAVIFGVVQSVGALFLSRALKLGDISLVTPLWKMSLLLLLAWAYVGAPTSPTLAGASGVLLSLLGVYWMNASRAKTSIWAPFTTVFKDPAQRWALLAGCGYAPSVILIKHLALHSDPFMAVFSGYTVSAIIMTPYTLWYSKKALSKAFVHWPSMIMVGLLGAISTWFGTVGYTLTFSAYVEAVKQVEIIFALGVGYFIFKEGKTIKEIWGGALLIAAGMVLIRLGE